MYFCDDHARKNIIFSIPELSHFNIMIQFCINNRSSTFFINDSCFLRRLYAQEFWPLL